MIAANSFIQRNVIKSFYPEYFGPFGFCSWAALDFIQKERDRWSEVVHLKTRKSERKTEKTNINTKNIRKERQKKKKNKNKITTNKQNKTKAKKQQTNNKEQQTNKII